MSRCKGPKASALQGAWRPASPGFLFSLGFVELPLMKLHGASQVARTDAQAGWRQKHGALGHIWM